MRILRCNFFRTHHQISIDIMIFTDQLIKIIISLILSLNIIHKYQVLV